MTEHGINLIQARICAWEQIYAAHPLEYETIGYLLREFYDLHKIRDEDLKNAIEFEAAIECGAPYENYFPLWWDDFRDM